MSWLKGIWIRVETVLKYLASFKCYLLWRVVNRTRQLLLKFSLLSSINSPRGREEEREETTDEIDMRSILFWGAMLLLLNKISWYYFPSWLIKGLIIWWSLICLFGCPPLCLFCSLLDATFLQICDYTRLDWKWFLYGECVLYQNGTTVLDTDSFVFLWQPDESENRTYQAKYLVCARDKFYHCLPLVFVGFVTVFAKAYLPQRIDTARVCSFWSMRRNILFMKGYLKEEKRKCNVASFFYFLESNQGKPAKNIYNCTHQ